MKPLHDTETLRKDLDAAKYTVRDLKDKQVDMMSFMTAMHTYIQLHKDTTAELIQKCAAAAVAFTDQLRQLDTRTTELNAARHVSQASNASR